MRSDASRFSVSLGNGDGTFASETTYAVTNGTGVARMQLGDVNGDGFADAVVAQTTGFAIYLNQGDGTFVLDDEIAATYTTSSIVLKDLTGDGVLDIFGSNSSGNGYSFLAGNSKTVGGLPEFSLLTQESSREALDTMAETLSDLSNSLGKIGAVQSRLQMATANNATQRQNILAAESRIRDADIAEETAALVRLQILQQASASVLAQANLQPALAVELLRS